MSAAPLFPAFVPRTLPQLRALHAIGKRLGLSHADLRAAAGVQSLNDLSCDAAARLIDRLNADRPRPERRRPRWSPGVIKPATPSQRNLIRRLFQQLGWPLAQCRGWLAKRYPAIEFDRLGEVDDCPAPLGPGVSSRVAHECINQLLAAQRRAAPAPPGQGGPS